MIYCPYQDSTRDIRSNIPLRLQEFPRASPSGTPSGEGVYLTVYPSSRPNTDTIYLCYEKSNICLGQILESMDTARDRELYGDHGEIKKLIHFLEIQPTSSFFMSFLFPPNFKQSYKCGYKVTASFNKMFIMQCTAQLYYYPMYYLNSN